MKVTARSVGFRIPLPKKMGGAHGTQKGKRGYDRKESRRIEREVRFER